MPIRFNPSGTLDVGTDPADLPAQVQGKVVVSGSMTRCTNLTLDRTGIASTRKGTVILNPGYDYSYTYDWEALELTGELYNPFIIGDDTTYSFTWETDIDVKTNDTRIINITPIEIGSISRILGQSGDRYAFSGQEIYLNEVSIAKELTDAAWEVIRYNSYNSSEQSLFALNGTDRKRITGLDVQEWGSDSPTFAPKIKAGALTGLTGDYNAKYTWCRKESDAVVWESNPSPAADNEITLSDESLEVSFTLPTDNQTTHVRIYRTSADGSLYLHDQDIELSWDTFDWTFIYDWEEDYLVGNLYQAFTYITKNMVAQYTWEKDPETASDDINWKSTCPFELTMVIDSDTADTALGTEVSWVNHNRPPLGNVVLGPNFNGTCFILKDNRLYYCLPNQPEYWPDDYYIEISSPQYPCIAGAFLDGILYVATAVEIYQVAGSGAGTFFPLPMSAQTGTISYRAFEAVKGHGIFHIGADGLYLYSGGTDQMVSRGNLDAIFAGNTAGSIPGLNRDYIENCWMKAFHGKLYFGYPGGESEYPDNVLVLDLQNQKLTHHTYAATYRAIGRDFTNHRLLAGDIAGYVWEWESKDAQDDEGTAIAWEIQSADFNQLRKYFPRYAKYDVLVGTGATANGYILLDDSIKQTHPLNGNRLTRKRLVDGCTGDRLAVRITGAGPVDIYGAEIE